LQWVRGKILSPNGLGEWGCIFVMRSVFDIAESQ
jgi:hypothetical protein